MSTISPPTAPEDFHHQRVRVNGTELHYVAAGAQGSPVLMVHGFPETWWIFHKLIPRLSEQHRVRRRRSPWLRRFLARRGGGDSTTSRGLGRAHRPPRRGPCSTTGRTSAAPRRSAPPPTPSSGEYGTAIETGLPGFGFSRTLADVTSGGAQYIGVLVAPGIPEMLLGRARSSPTTRSRP